MIDDRRVIRFGWRRSVVFVEIDDTLLDCDSTFCVGKFDAPFLFFKSPSTVQSLLGGRSSFARDGEVEGLMCHWPVNLAGKSHDTGCLKEKSDRTKWCMFGCKPLLSSKGKIRNLGEVLRLFDPLILCYTWKISSQQKMTGFCCELSLFSRGGGPWECVFSSLAAAWAYQRLVSSCLYIYIYIH